MKYIYVVEWNDHEGNLQERWFDDLRDARLEAMHLRDRFDYVEIREEKGCGIC